MANSDKMTDKNGNEYQVGDDVLLGECPRQGETLRITARILEVGFTWPGNHEIIRRADRSDPRVKGKGIEERLAETPHPLYGVTRCEDIYPKKKPGRPKKTDLSGQHETVELGRIVQDSCRTICHRDPTPAEQYAKFQAAVATFKDDFPAIEFTTDFNSSSVFVWLKFENHHIADKMSITATRTAWCNRLETVVSDFRFQVGTKKLGCNVPGRL